MAKEKIAEQGTMLRLEQIMGAIARGWCHSENVGKEMDPDLASAIYDEVVSLLQTDQTKKGSPLALKLKKSVVDCVREDNEQMADLEKGLNLIIGHTSEKVEVNELLFYYRGHQFGITIKNDGKRVLQ